MKQLLKALLEQRGAPSGSFWQYDPLAETSDLLVTVGGGLDAVYASLPKEAFEKVEEQGLSETLLHFTDIVWGSAALIRIPLFLESEYLGSFILTVPRARSYLPEEIELSQALAQQAVPILRLTRQAEQDRQDAVREERNRLACEIHDALAQHFAGISLQIGVAQRIAKQQPEEAWKLVIEAGLLARTAVEEARRSVWSLHPAATEYSDLAGTLSRTVAQMTAGAPVRGEVQVYGAPRLLPSDVGVNLLRIGQEALTNALHHAQAQHIFVELTFETGRLRLCIQDDGQGFDLQNQEEGGGFGLIGMRQRAERIRGTLIVRSQPGQGTEVVVTVATETATEGHQEAE